MVHPRSHNARLEPGIGGHGPPWILCAEARVVPSAELCEHRSDLMECVEDVHAVRVEDGGYPRVRVPLSSVNNDRVHGEDRAADVDKRSPRDLLRVPAHTTQLISGIRHREQKPFSDVQNVLTDVLRRLGTMHLVDHEVHGLVHGREVPLKLLDQLQVRGGHRGDGVRHTCGA